MEATMAETIEAFVAKLQKDGVEAGKQAADQLLADARKQAEAVVQQAQAQAKKIADDAQAQAAATIEKSRTDLKLAARDTAMRLREALSRALRAVLTANAKDALANPDFLKTLLHDIVMKYVQADLDKHVALTINVPHDMQQQLTAWAMEHLHAKAGDGDVSIDLRATLREAGFEYQADGANIEVTLASVVEALSDLVNPNLREMLAQAMAESDHY
jgi:V/A-type H+-transporting ATPase subunit E